MRSLSTTTPDYGGYSIGDTVEFLSVKPYRLRVNGRIKHYISAFGEHVIGKEVEEAMMAAARRFDTRTIEFTVAPPGEPCKRSALSRVVRRIR